METHPLRHGNTRRAEATNRPENKQITRQNSNFLVWLFVLKKGASEIRHFIPEQFDLHCERPCKDMSATMAM